jgi:hypothetical protein
VCLSLVLFVGYNCSSHAEIYVEIIYIVFIVYYILDMESLPSLNSLQMALLNDEEAEEELLSVMTHLLVCAIEDPGIPNPARHTTILGQSLKQADITHSNLSEILRIYLYANATGEVKALTGKLSDKYCNS